MLTATCISVFERPAAAEYPSQAEPPSCLDQSIRDELGERLRPRGVQKRQFLKRGHLHFTGQGGLFAADLLSSSYIYGGTIGYFFTEDFGARVGLEYTPLSLDLDAPVAAFFGDDRFEKGPAYLALASLLWSPVHAKLKVGDRIVHSDVVFTAGAGRLVHDSVQGVTFQAGMFLELLLSQWVTVRLEVRNVVAVQEAVAETRLTNNILATTGLVLWIPTGL